MIMLHRNMLTLEDDTVIRPTLSLNLCSDIHSGRWHLG
jgi:hypothetical protein